MQELTKTKRSLSLDALYELLRVRVFVDIDYASWLLDCMVNATFPISVKYCLLIKEYVSSLFFVPQLQRIPEEAIAPYFETCNDPSPSQILLLLYMLAYNDAIMASKTDPKLVAASNVSQVTKQHQEYSSGLLGRIPIRCMLNHVESYQQGKAYRNVYPDLLSLAANLYPEMFNITSFLLQEGKESDETAVEEPKEWDRFWISRLSPDKLEYILIHWQQNPDLVVKALSCIGAIDTIHIADYVDIVIRHLLPLCFNENFDDNIANAFSAVWESFDGIIPYELWVLTAKEMRDKNITNEGMYTLDNLVEDPLLLFKCDPKIFRCRRLLPIWLHLLSCIRVCSRHRIWKRFVTCFPRTQTSFNIRNVVAMINVQDAIMLQLLLEQCQEQPRDEGHADQLQQAREHICHFIHGIFVDGDRDGVLVKLLHFETYALDLIPIVVELIPSIYIVMNFIPELLRQPQPEKQIFGILIACHLCEKYPLEPYLVAAEKYVLPRLVKIAFPATREGQPTGCVPSEYLIQAIPGFVHLAKAFPHFAPQILRVFDDIFHGLPPPKDFIGQEGNTKIILFLRLHKTLKDARQLVQQQADRMESVNNVIL